VKRERLLYYFLFGVICVIWGTTWFAIKKGLEEVPPFRGAAFRFLIVSVMLLAIVVARRSKLPRTWHTLRAPVFLGVFYFFVPYSCMYWSEQYIPSALAAIIYGTVPLVVMVTGHFMLEKESVTPLKVISVLSGIAGVVVISLARQPEAGRAYLHGVLVMIFAALTTGYCTAYTKKHAHAHDIFVFLLVQIAVATILLSTASLVVEGPPTFEMNATSIVSILYLAVFGTVVGWSLWIFLIRKLSPVLVSYVSFFLPLVALVVGVTFGDERFSPLAILGTVLVFGSIVLVVQAVKESKTLVTQSPEESTHG
jgi:drug/metabolite transporter (DMT)-like permease